MYHHYQQSIILRNSVWVKNPPHEPQPRVQVCLRDPGGWHPSTLQQIVWTSLKGGGASWAECQCDRLGSRPHEVSQLHQQLKREKPFCDFWTWPCSDFELEPFVIFELELKINSRVRVYFEFKFKNHKRFKFKNHKRFKFKNQIDLSRINQYETNLTGNPTTSNDEKLGSRQEDLAELVSFYALLIFCVASI